MIRQATADDIPALSQVWFDAWHAGHAGRVPPALETLRTLDSFAERLGPRIARGDVFATDKLSGFIALNGCEIEQVHVAPAAHGTGVATTLMQAAQDELAKRGTTTAHLICIPDNARALAFYAKHGWREVARGPETVETSDGPFDLICCRLEKALA